MQVAGKAVEHVEKFLDVMDRASVETAMLGIMKSIMEFKNIIDGIGDPLNKYRFEQEFGDDITRAERAYEACKTRMEEL